VVFLCPKMFANPHKDLTLSHLYVKLKSKEANKLMKVNKLIQKWSVQLEHRFEPKDSKTEEASYFAESKNKKDGKLSLQFPVFVRLREFGKEVSYA
jgi:hypothetical protein